MVFLLGCFLLFHAQELGGNLQFQPDTLDVQMGTTTSALIAVITGKLKVRQSSLFVASSNSKYSHVF